MKRDHVRRSALSIRRAIALSAPVALVVVAGCYGGDDKKALSSSKAEPAKSAIKVEGRAASVTAVDGEVDVLLMSPASTNIETMLRFMGRMKSADLKEAAPGAYTAFGDSLSLLAGTVTDISGNGAYAIGKWTDGSDSSGATYNRSQARFWAVGQPVQVDLKEGAVMHCTLASATRPTAADGNTAPGTLHDASAEIRRISADKSPEMTLSLRYSIGQRQETVTLASSPGGYTSRFMEDAGGGAQRSDRYVVASRFVGHDPKRPYLNASYTLKSGAAGVISGVVALSCS